MCQRIRKLTIIRRTLIGLNGILTHTGSTSRLPKKSSDPIPSAPVVTMSKLNPLAKEVNWIQAAIVRGRPIRPVVAIMAENSNKRLLIR